jgi:hypothetical protein
MVSPSSSDVLKQEIFVKYGLIIKISPLIAFVTILIIPNGPVLNINNYYGHNNVAYGQVNHW